MYVTAETRSCTFSVFCGMNIFPQPRFILLVIFCTNIMKFIYRSCHTSWLSRNTQRNGCTSALSKPFSRRQSWTASISRGSNRNRLPLGREGTEKRQIFWCLRKNPRNIISLLQIVFWSLKTHPRHLSTFETCSEYDLDVKNVFFVFFELNIYSIDTVSYSSDDPLGVVYYVYAPGSRKV